jgi:hypothetical protein
MSNLKLISDYKDNAPYRLSFNELTSLIFNFNPEKWYQAGYWNDQYVPFSFVDSGKVVANVSINKMNLILNGKRLQAIQIGTVMTHPDYRGKRLAFDLMNIVLDRYENDVPLIYLSAESRLGDYYPRFGFRGFKENHFTATVAGLKLRKNGQAKKLDMSAPGVERMIYDKALTRKPLSNVFGVENLPSLLMFYCMTLFRNCIYHIEEEDVLALYKEENGILHVYDIISSKRFDIQNVLSKIITAETALIDFQFTPDLLPIKTNMVPYELSEDIFFALGDFALPKPFRCHKTAQA